MCINISVCKPRFREDLSAPDVMLVLSPKAVPQCRMKPEMGR